MVAPINSSFEAAFGAFKQFFRLKVGRGWDERLGCGRAGEKIGPASGEGFFYRPPKEGSRGVVKGESVVASVEGGNGVVGGGDGGQGGAGASAPVGKGDGVLAGGLKAGES